MGSGVLDGSAIGLDREAIGAGRKRWKAKLTVGPGGGFSVRRALRTRTCSGDKAHFCGCDGGAGGVAENAGPDGKGGLLRGRNAGRKR